MSRKNLISLGDAIKAYFKARRFDEQILENKIKGNWERVVGANFASYTQEIDLRYGILVVKISSSVVRNELMMHKSVLIKSLNESVKSNVIKDIQFR